MKNTENILKFIPQRPPFVMVDELLSANEVISESSFTILKENILVDKNFFTEAGIIENIAQTCAMQAGYIASTNNKETPKGMIGAIKKMVINFLPGIDTTIRTTTDVLREVLNAKIVKGMVYQNEKVIAECEMTVFLF